jgi:hypothetical protein
VFFDYDDTLVATTEVKGKRLEMYKAYLKTQGIAIADEQATNIMSITDKFSRWEENEGEGKLYHANVHMGALQWATNVVKENPDKAREVITDLQKKLDRIKSQLTSEQLPQEDDPFYFRPKDKKFILRGINKRWSKLIEDIFTQTMINPPQYEETIQAAKQTGKPYDSIHRTNLGVFTYGDPYYQLHKVFELMKQHPDFPISQIWLTRVPKGDFIVQAVKETATTNLEQDYVPADLEDYPGGGIASGSGYVLGQTDHVIVMLDDNPRELFSILKSNDYLRENTKSQFIVVRSKRDRTKALNTEWQVSTPYGELDFTQEQPLRPSDISNIFLINIYLSVKSRLERDNSSYILGLQNESLQKELRARGITLEE